MQISYTSDVIEYRMEHILEEFECDSEALQGIIPPTPFRQDHRPGQNSYGTI